MLVVIVVSLALGFECFFPFISFRGSALASVSYLNFQLFPFHFKPLYLCLPFFSVPLYVFWIYMFSYCLMAKFMKYCPLVALIYSLLFELTGPEILEGALTAVRKHGGCWTSS